MSCCPCNIYIPPDWRFFMRYQTVAHVQFFHWSPQGTTRELLIFSTEVPIQVEIFFFHRCSPLDVITTAPLPWHHPYSPLKKIHKQKYLYSTAPLAQSHTTYPWEKKNSQIRISRKKTYFGPEKDTRTQQQEPKI
jgi:hypothetical protein